MKTETLIAVERALADWKEPTVTLSTADVLEIVRDLIGERDECRRHHMLARCPQAS